MSRPLPATQLDETRRRIHEARDWIRRGYTSPDTVAELIERVAKHRGAQMAEQLRADMREQWRTRAEWMTTEGTTP